MIRFLAVLIIVSCSVQTLSADEWARRLFDKRSHDFGTVARGSKTEHVFEFKNTLDRAIHVARVHTSCRCITPTVGKYTIQPGEVGQIIAKYNTRSFYGQRGATVTVTFDRPSYARVQLQLDGYIRRDVVCHPGQIDFGKVRQGQSCERKIDIQYAGRNDWRIEKVTCSNPEVKLQLQETRRGRGRVGYDLIASLTEKAACGYLNQEVVLHTNDRRLRQVPISLSGTVVSAVTASPANLYFGKMAVGATLEKKIVVQAEQPIRIVGFQCDDRRIQADVPQEAKKLHLIPVRAVCDGKPRPIQSEIVIQTDLESVRIKLTADSGQ